MTQVLSGIFFHLGKRKESTKDYSKKWWAVILMLTVLVVLIVAALIAISLTARSGVGIHVVAGTFLLAMTSLLTASYIKRINLPNNQVTRHPVYLPVAIVSVFFAITSLVLGYIIYPTDPIGFGIVMIAGGIVLSVFFLLVYEGYPRLKIHGSPGILAISGLLMVTAIIYMTVIADWIVPYSPFHINVGGIREPPNPSFPLGTTSLGQDMLSRVIAGGATMLQVAAISVVVCFSIGVPIGLLSGYRGGLVDKTIGLVMDSLFAFPGLVLAIAIAAILGPGILNMAIAIAVVYIPSYFRVVRSQVFTVRELPYVEAAIVMGARDRDILFRYILPNVLPSSVVIMSINFADAILTAAGLTFVGLGLSVDIADWGWDLTLGFQVLIVGAWWISAFPGLMVILLALGFTLTGEGLNEILTPKLRE